MSFEHEILLLRLAALVSAGVFGVGLLLALIHGLGGGSSAALARYRNQRDHELRLLFLPERGRHIVLAQAASAVACLGLSAWLSTVAPLFALPVVALAPGLFIKSLRARHTQQIEAKLDGLALTLANALRATPSIGRALEMVQKVLPVPLDKEVELMLREMRVGNSVEQSLMSLSARVKSVSLDAVLSGILIGRQVGGNLPEILETTSATLREMGRLDGVLRSKTAEGKAQVWVLALFPLILGLGFNTVNPGYFTPMTQSGLGMVLLGCAVTFWMGSIMLARRILSVEL